MDAILLNEMCFGKRNLFIHGGAGTGKSHLIKQMQAQRVNAIYAAPSGIAALNINGTTIHSLFNFEPSIQFPDNFNSVWNKLLLENADTLLIDEISMVRCDVFDKIDQVLRGIRKDDRPFGGMRIIIVGDLFQLGAIAEEKDKRYLRDLYPDAYGDYSFYKAECFNRADFALCELTYNYRQKDDAAFAEILDAVRTGTSDDAMLAILNTRCRIEPPTDQYYYLTIDNVIARSININFLKELPDTIEVSSPVEKILVPVPYLAERLQACPMNHNLGIKTGMKIMFIKNDSHKNGNRWVNGTIGSVSKKNYVGNQVESVIITIKTKVTENLYEEEEYEVVREHYGIFEPLYNAITKRIDIVPVADVYQFPFQAAWAMTIHKAQDLTLDKVMIDLSYGAFAHSQTYVALSRARRLSDLWLTRPIRRNDILVSKHTQAFYQSMKMKPPTFETAPVESRAEHTAFDRAINEEEIDYELPEVEPPIERYIAAKKIAAEMDLDILPEDAELMNDGNYIPPTFNTQSNNEIPTVEPDINADISQHTTPFTPPSEIGDEDFSFHGDYTLPDDIK